MKINQVLKKTSFKPILKWVFILTLFTLITGCTNDNSPEPSEDLKVFKVQAEKVHKTLHFPGTMQPILEHTLTAPIDGVIEEMSYDYGQWVEKDNLIFSLNFGDDIS